MAAKFHGVPTLYHAEWYGSSIPYQVLLELNIPQSRVAVREIKPEQLKSDEQVVLYSPRRVLPFMVFPDGSAIVESAAILLHLCETYDTTHALHPALGHPARPRFLQGVVFGVAEGDKAVMSVFGLCYGIKKENRDQGKLGPAKESFNKIFIDHLIYELQKGKGAYYLGDNFSAADIVMGYMLMIAQYSEEDLIKDKVVEAYYDRLRARQSYKTLFSSPFPQP